MRAADVVFTQTPGGEWVLEESWLRPHALIVCSGSDQPTKNEIPPNVLKKAKVVTDITAQCARVGEVRSAVAAGVMTVDDVHARVRLDLVEIVLQPVHHAGRDVVDLFEHGVLEAVVQGHPDLAPHELDERTFGLVRRLQQQLAHVHPHLRLDRLLRNVRRPGPQRRRGPRDRRVHSSRHLPFHPLDLRGHALVDLAPQQPLPGVLLGERAEADHRREPLVRQQVARAAVRRERAAGTFVPHHGRAAERLGGLGLLPAARRGLHRPLGAQRRGGRLELPLQRAVAARRALDRERALRRTMWWW